MALGPGANRGDPRSATLSARARQLTPQAIRKRSDEPRRCPRSAGGTRGHKPRGGASRVGAQDRGGRGASRPLRPSGCTRGHPDRGRPPAVETAAAPRQPKRRFERSVAARPASGARSRSPGGPLRPGACRAWPSASLRGPTASRCGPSCWASSWWPLPPGPRTPEPRVDPPGQRLRTPNGVQNSPFLPYCFCRYTGMQKVKWQDEDEGEQVPGSR